MTESVKKACGPIVESLGYDLVDVTYMQEYGVWELTLLIKNKSGNPINHKDCERVSVAVDEVIEKLDPTKGQSYSLSVSSVGVN